MVCKICGKQYKQSKNPGYCSFNCKKLEENLNNLEILQTPTTELGVKILELRKTGMSQKAISEELNCSKSTVSYYCSGTTKKKSEERSEKHKELNPTDYKISKQVSNFRIRKKENGKLTMCSDWNHKMRTQTSNFRVRNKMKVEKEYSYKDAIQHLGGYNTRCYLTGRSIDLTKDDYCLDHINPCDKRGNNELENMGITIPEANASKTNLTVDEYLALCKEVLENYGYLVTK